MRWTAMLSACFVILALPAAAAATALGTGCATAADAGRLLVVEEGAVQPDRPRARPLPGPGGHRHGRRPSRPAPRESEQDGGPIGCPDLHRKLELIV